MRQRFVDSDGLGAIFPPMIYTVIALRCLGHADDSPEMQWALKQLDELIIEEDGAIRLQPCFSPVWDTALSVIAVCDAADETTAADDGDFHTVQFSVLGSPFSVHHSAMHKN